MVMVTAVLVPTTTAASSPDLASGSSVDGRHRVMGGRPAPGDSRVVSLAMHGAEGWTQCSGALWQPRLILTAAHCVTPSGTSNLVDRVAVFAPGVAAQIYRDTGPQGPSAAQVSAILRPPGYLNASERVSPNDIAVLVLDRDLAPAGFQRLASWPEVQRWQEQGVAVTHVGYGLIGPGQRTTLPNTVDLALSAAAASSNGVRFSTAQTDQTATCPGDSGSPTFRTTGSGDLLVGVVAGSSAPCTVGAAGVPGASGNGSGLTNLGFVALGYPDLLDAALTAAGYSTIPGGPTDIAAGWLPGSPGSVVVTWTSTARNAGSIVGVEVWDGDSLVCPATTATWCTVTGAAPGLHDYRARSVNAQNEGDVSTAVASVEVPQSAGAALSSLTVPREGPVQPWIIGQPIVAFAGCLARTPKRAVLTATGNGAGHVVARGVARRDPGLCPATRRPLALTYAFTLADRDVARFDATGAGTVAARSEVDGRSRGVRRPAFASVQAWTTALLAGR